MAIYRQGQASMDAQGYVTGYDTKWREQLTLIRPGATIFFLTQPLQAAVITEVISDTSIRAITTGGSVVQKTNYLILLHDSLTVDGLAQDVAETLRYYQSKETEIADALEFFRDFDLDGFKDLVNQVKQGAESAKQSASAAKTSETNAKTSETNAENSANKAKTEADRAAAAAESSEAQNRVPYAGVTVNAPTGVRDMLKRLRDSVRGGFWRVDDISQFPSGEMRPFRYGPGVCGGAGDTFFAFNVDYQTSRVKVFAGNNAAINGSSGNVGAIELAKLGANGDVAIGDGGTGASNDQGARANLQVMHERKASLVSEDLNVLQGDKAGFYYTGLSANATQERNYPVQEAGCLLVQRTGANDPKSCIQTFTGYNSGRSFMRWLSNATTGIWSKWYELYNAGSSPTFSGVITGPAVRASANGKSVTIKPGDNDVTIHNSASNKYLQLKDDGGLSYDNKPIAYNGLVTSGTFRIESKDIAVKTSDGGFKIEGTVNEYTQPLFVAAYNLAGTRLWFLGKDRSGTAGFYNDMAKGKLEVGADGSVVIGTKDFAGKVYAQAASIEVDRPSGKYFKMMNDGNSSHPATFKLWGNGSDRASVIEWGFDNGPGWVFYGQLNKDNSKYLQVKGHVNATAFNQASDRDIKDNIEEIENATESLRKMSGYTYTLKENGLPYAGVIAQEVMEAIPEAVSGFTQHTDLAGPTKDGTQLVGEERFLSVDYGAVTGLLVKVCRESDDRISKLEKEVAELKDLLSKLITNPATLN